MADDTVFSEARTHRTRGTLAYEQRDLRIMFFGRSGLSPRGARDDHSTDQLAHARRTTLAGERAEAHAARDASASSRRAPRSRQRFPRCQTWLAPFAVVLSLQCRCQGQHVNPVPLSPPGWSQEARASSSELAGSWAAPACGARRLGDVPVPAGFFVGVPFTAVSWRGSISAECAVACRRMTCFPRAVVIVGVRFAR